MNIIVDAVFEDGVLKPLGAAALAEHERVRVSIQCAGSATPDDSDPAVLARQHEAIKALLAEAQQMPIPGAGDGFSGADHDEALYRRPA